MTGGVDAEPNGQQTKGEGGKASIPMPLQRPCSPVPTDGASSGDTRIKTLPLPSQDTHRVHPGGGATGGVEINGLQAIFPRLNAEAPANARDEREEAGR